MNSAKWFETEVREMVSLISATKTPAETRQIFEYILTPREINDMGKRLKILQMLAGGYSYSEIRNRLGVSSSLISRLSCHLGYGFRRCNVPSKRPGATKLSVAFKNYLRAPKVKYKGIPTPLPRWSCYLPYVFSPTVTLLSWPRQGQIPPHPHLTIYTDVPKHKNNLA